MKRSTRAERKMWAGVLTVILLTICLAFTTYALVMVRYSVEDNATYITGEVKINLNDEEPIIEEGEFAFEPGVLVEKEFFVRNESTDDIYYRIYFDNVAGTLADVIEVTITDPGILCSCNDENPPSKDPNRPRQITGKILYEGSLKDLENRRGEIYSLALDECRHLYMYFHFPEESGNEYMLGSASFDVCADAVQQRNNPAKDFGPELDSN